MEMVHDKKLRIVWLCQYPVDKILPETCFVRKRHYHPSPWLVNTISILSQIPEIELYVVTLNAHIKKNTSIELNGVSYFVIKKGIKFLNYGYPKYLRLDLFSLFCNDSRRIKKVLKNINPDLMHAFGSEVPYGIAAIRSGYKVVYSLQGLMQQMSKLYPKNLNYRIMGHIESKIVRTCNNFISQSAAVSNHIIDINSKAQIYNTYYPINTCFYEVKPADTKPIDIVFVGSIIDVNKGFNILINSFNQLYQKGFRANITVIGNNTKSISRIKEKFNTIAKNFQSFTFLGHLSHKELASVYAKAKILVIPSALETYSMTVAEGMASGLCVIASDTSGIRSLIVNNKNGLFFNTGKSDDLAKKLEMALLSEDLVKELGKNAREFAILNFDPQTIGNNHLSFYKQIINDLNS